MGEMKLRPYQEEARAKIEEGWAEGTKKLLLVLPTGCHAPDQGILMADGTIKAAKDINVGDRLMGDDGTPRTVLALHAGETEMYSIKPVKGDPFIVTKDHVLPLVRTNEKKNPQYPSQALGGTVGNITVEDYIVASNYYKHMHKLYRAKCIKEFYRSSNDAGPLDPYFLGLLLGDGGLKNGQISITTPDQEIASAIMDMAKIYGASVRTEPAGKANTYFLANSKRLREEIKETGILYKGSYEKSVPFAYKTASAEIRKEVLAGLLDTDGHLHVNGYDYISASLTLAEDVAFIARSLGLAAYVKGCFKGYENFVGTYWRVSISGETDKIPMRVKRKQAGKRGQKKDVLRTGIEKITPLGMGKYSGFTVDGNNLYLMDDFTVTHNCGKTIVFAKITEDEVRKGKRVLILAHRGELLDQAADKIKKATGLGCSVEKAEETSQGSWYRVTVGSVQSMFREKRLARFSNDYFDVIIVDEAHHILSDTYQKVINHFPEADVLGVTATADRGDMRNLGEFFDAKAYEYTLPQAIKEGYLSRIKALTIPLKIDMRNVGISNGDYAVGETGHALEPYLEQIADEMVTACSDRKTVVFLPLINTSQKFRDILESRGFRAAEVNGNSADRAEVLKDFDEGRYNVLCNSMLLTEGWDCPSVDCIVVLRPTKVRSLYSQMVGRGTRLFPGKDHLLLLDFLWMTEKHELCRPAHLICKDPETLEQMIENAEKEPGTARDIEEDEQRAKEDVILQREQALAKQLEEMRRRKKKLVDPLQFEMSIQAEDLAGYEPSFAWEMAPPSKKQLESLEKYGICPDDVSNAGKAAKILDRLAKRRAEGLTTPKQIRFLERKGFRHVGTWQFDDAKKLIDRIAANGWSVPWEINPEKYVPEPVAKPAQDEAWTGIGW